MHVHSDIVEHHKVTTHVGDISAHLPMKLYRTEMYGWGVNYRVYTGLKG